MGARCGWLHGYSRPGVRCHRIALRYVAVGDRATGMRLGPGSRASAAAAGALLLRAAEGEDHPAGRPLPADPRRRCPGLRLAHTGPAAIPARPPLGRPLLHRARAVLHPTSHDGLRRIWASGTFRSPPGRGTPTMSDRGGDAV